MEFYEAKVCRSTKYECNNHAEKNNPHHANRKAINLHINNGEGFEEGVLGIVS